MEKKKKKPGKSIEELEALIKKETKYIRDLYKEIRWKDFLKPSQIARREKLMDLARERKTKYKDQLEPLLHMEDGNDEEEPVTD